MTADRPLRVLALCLGNICRSPVAEELLRQELQKAGVNAVVDSAGTGDWHVGRPADPRSREVARRHGLVLGGRGRQLTAADFYEQDVILAMDAQNLADARRLSPPNAGAKVQLMREFDPQAPGADVPDPYYGGPDGFEQMFTMLERSAREFARQAKEGTLQHWPKEDHSFGRAERANGDEQDGLEKLRSREWSHPGWCSTVLFHGGHHSENCSGSAVEHSLPFKRPRASGRNRENGGRPRR